MKSIKPIKFILFFIFSIMLKNREDNFCKIISVSIISSFFKLFKSLFKSKTDIGSINTVEPDWEISWINPLTSWRDSFFTGTTNLPFLKVTTGSCTCLECIIEFNFDLISCSFCLIDFLILYNSFDASSESVFSSNIEVNIVFSKLLLEY